MSAVRLCLLPLLRERYSDARYEDADPELVVAFAGPGEVGDLEVWEEGDVATVVVGRLTHTHFNGYDSYPCPAGTPKDEVVRRVAKEVLKFLEDFFAERIVLWKKSSDGGVSLGPIEAMPEPAADGSLVCYTWKGRLNPKAG